MKYRRLGDSDRHVSEIDLPLSAAHGFGRIVWSPLAQGMLTGRYRPANRSPQPGSYRWRTPA